FLVICGVISPTKATAPTTDTASPAKMTTAISAMIRVLVIWTPRLIAVSSSKLMAVRFDDNDITKIIPIITHGVTISRCCQSIFWMAPADQNAISWPTSKYSWSAALSELKNKVTATPAKINFIGVILLFEKKTAAKTINALKSAPANDSKTKYG